MDLRYAQSAAAFVIFLTLASSVACDSEVVLSNDASNSNDRLQCINDKVCRRPDLNSLRFILLGDSGGLPIYPYTSYAQNKIAKAMASIGDEYKTEFLLSVGDNIYYTGVSDVDDSRFQSSFEDVYAGEALSKPWYFIAGNHDHFGNISAQVAYTNKSKRWTFPALYYKFSYEFGPQKKLAEFIMIDTIVLCGNTRDIEAAGFVEMIFAGVSKDPNNPKDPQEAKKQLQWIENQLRDSKADYLFVVGHYPVYSVSSHGPSTCLLQKLKPLLTKYNVSAYFSGHDHTLQHIIVKNYSHESEATEQEPTVMHYVISGASSRSDRSTKHEDKIPFGSLRFNYPTGFNPLSQLGFSNGGFVYVELKEDEALFKFFNGKSSQKYHFSMYPRKVASSS